MEHKKKTARRAFDICVLVSAIVVTILMFVIVHATSRFGVLGQTRTADAVTPDSVNFTSFRH